MLQCVQVEYNIVKWLPGRKKNGGCSFETYSRFSAGAAEPTITSRGSRLIARSTKRARQCFEDYVDDFIQEFRAIEDFEDLSAKDCVFRIYRDVRFSKDKSPYKPNMGASVALGGKHSLRAPYYIHLEPPDKSFLAGGIYMPTPDQLAAIRRAIDRDPARLKAAINSKPFKKYFGSLSGEKTQDAAARLSRRSS